MLLALGFLLAAFGLAAVVARMAAVPFRVALVQVSGAVLIAGAGYYQIDGVGRPPLRAGLEIGVNGLLLGAGVLGLTGGVRRLRTIVIVGLAAHGVWDLLHVAPVLSPPRHEWLPLPCVVTDWVLAAALALLPLADPD